MSFVTKHQKTPLPLPTQSTVPDPLPPIAPPYVSQAHYGDPAFETRAASGSTATLNPFPGWRREDDFLVDL